jgi:low temperature requirement protein LtrA
MAMKQGQIQPALRAPTGQGASFVELFFDLVFVFALTQVTIMLGEDLTWTGLLHAILAFWLIWWAWTQYTWALNATNTDSKFVQIVVLIASGVAFFMATGVRVAFEAGPLWFVVPYILVRLMGLGLYLGVATAGGNKKETKAVLTYASLSLTGFVAVFVGGLVDTPLRETLWCLTIILDLIAGMIGGRTQGYNINVDHFTERHALFIIIALGESLIDIGISTATQEHNTEHLISAICAVILVCLLWWTYFGWIKAALAGKLREATGSSRSSLASETYSFLHFPLIGGIIGIAIAFEHVLSHPHEPLTTAVLLALTVGIALFVGAAGAAWFRASKHLLVVRAVILLLMTGALIASSALMPIWLLVITIVAIASIVIIEQHTVAKSYGFIGLKPRPVMNLPS